MDTSAGLDGIALVLGVVGRRGGPLEQEEGFIVASTGGQAGVGVILGVREAEFPLL